MIIPSTKIHSALRGHSHVVDLKSRLAALLVPLKRLDQRLQQTLEVQQTLLGTAFEGYLLGGVLPTQPPALAIVYDSPLAQLKRTFGLSDFDIEVVLMAIAPELDRRYERLYASLQLNMCRKPTVGLALNLLCSSMAEKEMRCDRFQKESPLLRQGLLQLKKTQSANRDLMPKEGSPDLPQADPFHRAGRVDPSDSFGLNPSVSRHLLGQPMNPQLSAYCQLSWPPKTAHLTNSPLIPDLLQRLVSDTLPAQLALNFTGAGDKTQSAQMIAAALNRPLLMINVGSLLEGDALSNDEIGRIAQQVRLQGRLWDAVLYVESEDTQQTDSRWFPTAIARSFTNPSAATVHQPSNALATFCCHLTTYPGIVIFTGQSLFVPSANGFKGLINVPFAPLPNDQTHTNWLEVAHITLGETEHFRQRLIETSGDA